MTTRIAPKIAQTRRPTFSYCAEALVLALLLGGCSRRRYADRRLDYYHTGNATQELFSLDKLVIEPLPWPGDPRQPVDHTNLGKYLFEVIDRNTNRVIYSRGFASIYGEWETTDEAKKANRTFMSRSGFRHPTSQSRWC